MLGLAIGAAMCYPGIQLSALSAGAEAVTTVLEGTLFQSPVYIDFFGIPVISVDYTGTVIPVILTVWFASKCEKLFNRFVPDLVKFFFVPMLTLLVTLPVAMIFLGPVATFGSTLISEFTLMIREFSPLLAGAVVGFTWQILVIFGMHWGFIPVYINNVQTLGYDNVMMPFFTCTFATSAVVLAMFFKTKDKKIKEKDKTEEQAPRLNYITECLLKKNLILEDEVSFVDDLVNTYQQSFNGIDINCKCEYILKKMKTKHLKNRMNYFKSAFEKNIYQDFQKESNYVEPVEKIPIDDEALSMLEKYD